MASEAVLKELFQLSKLSPQFKGISDDDIWKACLSFKERSDDDIRIAMRNIQKKDQKALEEAKEQQANFKEGKHKMIQLHEQERIDHLQDEKNAEIILAELFHEK